MSASPTRVRTRGGRLLLVAWAGIVAVLATAAWLGGHEATPPPQPAPPRSLATLPSTIPTMPPAADPVSIVLPKPGDVVAGNAVQLVVDIARSIGRVQASVQVAGVTIGRTWFETTVVGRLEAEIALLAPFESASAEVVLTPLAGGPSARVPIGLESTDRLRVLYPADGQQVPTALFAMHGTSAVATAVIVGTAAGRPTTGDGTAGDGTIRADLRGAQGQGIEAAGSGGARRSGIAAGFAVPLHAEHSPAAGSDVVTVRRGSDLATSRIALTTAQAAAKPTEGHETLDELRFAYPSSWDETRFAGPLPFKGTADGLLAYASNALLDPCRLDRAIGSGRPPQPCEWPVGLLGPGQLLVAWFRSSSGRFLPGGAGAIPPQLFDVDGHPAQASLELGGLCAPVGLATLQVELAGPVAGTVPATRPPTRRAPSPADRPVVTHRVVGCLGGGSRQQIAREIESILDVVASTRWTVPPANLDR